MTQNSNHQYWQIPDQVDHEAAEEAITATSVHVQNQPPNPTTHVPHNSRSNNNLEVAELTWENGQPAVHGYRGHDDLQTLESIVHQAKSLKHNINMHMNMNMNMIMMTRSSPREEAGKWGVAPENVQTNDQLLTKKRLWPETWRDDDLSRSGGRQLHDHTVAERSGCGSASATFCRENFTDDHTSSMTPSLDSPTSLKTKTTHEHDSAFHGKDKEEDEETKGETVRSHATRRSRVAGIHNESERRRRDRINQKMKALQKLVPNARKTDKASMLDEVIDYLRKLQAQVNLMSSRVNPQMMMMKNPDPPPPPPLALLMLQQQRLQMSLQLSGLGMGVINSNPPMPPSSISGSVPQCLASAAPTFLPAFVVPSAVPPSPLPFPAANCDASAYHHPYAAYFAQQAENMDFYSKMAILYGQATASQSGTTTASDQNPPSNY